MAMLLKDFQGAPILVYFGGHGDVHWLSKPFWDRSHFGWSGLSLGSLRNASIWLWLSKPFGIPFWWDWVNSPPIFEPF